MAGFMACLLQKWKLYMAHFASATLMVSSWFKNYFCKIYFGDSNNLFISKSDSVISLHCSKTYSYNECMAIGEMRLVGANSYSRYHDLIYWSLT